MPRDPTSPDGWKIYDFAEAVAFAARWSGLEPRRVREVLAARQRYLELAGIAETDPDDEALEAERVRFAHIFPLDGRTVDGLETAYLVQVTSATEVVIGRVFQGEWAYLDALDLVEWESPKERDQALGSPEAVGLEDS